MFSLASVIKGSAVFRKVLPFVVDHSPVILAALAGAGAVSTTVAAVKNTVTAVKKVEETGVSFKEQPLEFTKIVAPCYIPTALCLIATEGFVFGGLNASMRKIAALTTLTQLDEERLNEIIEVHNQIEDKKPEEEQNKIMASKFEQPYPSPYLPSAGMYPMALIKDSVTGQTFNGNIENLKGIASALNQRLYSGDQFITFEEWALETGMNTSSVSCKLAFTPERPIIPRFRELEVQTTWPFMPMIIMDYEYDPVDAYCSY